MGSDVMVPDKERYQRITALSPKQREALAQQLHQLGVLRHPELSSPTQRLVAYVVPRSPDSPVDPTALRDCLKAKLPPYLVPAAIVPLSAVPRTANGKVDTQALPDPPSAKVSTDFSTVPWTATEATLAQIWSDVLGLEVIGIHDNFFELGGDSILSIQIVSKAREAGLQLTPNQLFEQPTVAELATVVNLQAPVTALQTPVTGPIPLTPIQHWFFEQAMVAPQHWHQAMLVELPLGLSVAAVTRAIATLWNHHDALRLQFHRTAMGWQQRGTDANTPPVLTQIDLSSWSPAEQIRAVAQPGSQLHAGFNLTTGGLMRAAYFNRGTHQPSWLLLSLHHLVVDAISWQILYNDLATVLTQPEVQSATQSELPQNQSPQHPVKELPAKTTAFKTWAETLRTQAAVRQPEAPLWFDQVEPPVIALPQDTPEAHPSTEATTQTVTLALDPADTQALLQSVPAVYNTQINDVLLTALAQTLCQWAGAQSGSLRIEVEAHGREPIAPNLDVSRTVGWFTTTYPVRLQLSDRANSDISTANNWAAALKSIKEQLRQIPDRGIGYGLLRYLGDEPTRHRLAQAHPPEILFNYLGQRHLTPVDTAIRILPDIDMGTLRDPRNQRCYRLEINAWIANEQLQIQWRYDVQHYRSDTLTALAQQYLKALKALITHCTLTDSGSFTPSDFPDADLSQTELDDFITQLTQEAP